MIWIDDNGDYCEVIEGAMWECIWGRVNQIFYWDRYGIIFMVSDDTFHINEVRIRDN